MKSHGENYDDHYGFINWNGKVVLDCGADYGSTAKFFFSRGAKKVIAVEFDNQYWDALVALSKESEIIPVRKFLATAGDFEDLIDNYDVDIIKVDIEGGETGLLDVSCEYLRKIPEFAVEYHGGGPSLTTTVNHPYKKMEMAEKLREKFESCGFVVTYQHMNTLFAVRNDRNGDDKGRSEKLDG